MLGILRKFGNHRCGGGTGANHQYFFAGVVCIRIPQLGVSQKAAKFVHTRPLRNVRILVVIVALAHPQEIAGKGEASAVRFAGRCYGPSIVLGRPTAVGNAVAVSNMLIDTVLFDHLTHIFEDRLGTRDGRIRPRLEAIAESIEI